MHHDVGNFYRILNFVLSCHASRLFSVLFLISFKVTAADRYHWDLSAAWLTDVGQVGQSRPLDRRHVPARDVAARRSPPPARRSGWPVRVGPAAPHASLHRAGAGAAGGGAVAVDRRRDLAQTVAPQQR